MAEGDFGDAGRPWWIAHGCLMFIAWGICIPLGTIIAVWRGYVGNKIMKKQPSFYPWHRNLQTFGFFLTFIAFGLGYKGSVEEYGTGNPFDPILWDFTNSQIQWNRHVKMGWTVMMMSIAQVILGIWHHWIKAKHDARGDAAGPWKRLIVPSWAHVILGVGTMILAYLTQYQGIQIADFIYDSSTTQGGFIAGYAILSIFVALFLGFYIAGKAKKAGVVAAKEAAPYVDEEAPQDQMEQVEDDQPMEEPLDEPTKSSTTKKSRIPRGEFSKSGQEILAA